MKDKLLLTLEVSCFCLAAAMLMRFTFDHASRRIPRGHDVPQRPHQAIQSGYGWPRPSNRPELYRDVIYRTPF